MYLIGTLIVREFVLYFVICIILLACDFWMIKNVSGRLLVGYRWWNEIAEDGSSSWKFETIPDRSIIPQQSSVLFWGMLWVYPAIWSVFALISLLKLNFDNLLICLSGLVLGGMNLLGYLKCSRRSSFHLLFSHFILLFHQRIPVKHSAGCLLQLPEMQRLQLSLIPKMEVMLHSLRELPLSLVHPIS